jgi:serine/threonine protein kinase
MSTKKHKRKYRNGGKVIASGGFGCVFSPALKCEGKSSRGKNRISKLLTKKHALEEYNEVELFKKKLNKIPQYENYFLLNGFEICKPAKLDKSDLAGFSSKCSALPKDKITQENINKSLDKVFALNMPNGGLPIDDFIIKNNTYKNIIKLNNTLINLLNNGIIPMNENNIYHCDMKDSNILVDNSSGFKTRLIDWGLSTEYIPNIDQPFPKTWRNRPFQFNVPFSIIIFSDLFFDKYSKYIKQGGKLDYENLKPFVIDYIYLWIKERGMGHYSFINIIMLMLFGNELKNIDEKNKEKIIESEFTLPYICNYIIEILINFTKFREDGSLNLRVYLDTVFIKIVDIWGFVISYIPIFELLHENYENLNKIEIQNSTLIVDYQKDKFPENRFQVSELPNHFSGVTDMSLEYVNIKTPVDSGPYLERGLQYNKWPTLNEEPKWKGQFPSKPMPFHWDMDGLYYYGKKDEKPKDIIVSQEN